MSDQVWSLWLLNEREKLQDALIVTLHQHAQAVLRGDEKMQWRTAVRIQRLHKALDAVEYQMGAAFAPVIVEVPEWTA